MYLSPILTADIPWGMRTVASQLLELVAFIRIPTLNNTISEKEK